MSNKLTLQLILVIGLCLIFTTTYAQIGIETFKNCAIELSKLSDKTYNRYAPVYFKRGILYAQDKIGAKEGIGTKLMYSRLVKSRSSGFKKGITFLQDNEKYKNVGPAAADAKSRKLYFTANHPKKFVLMNDESIYKLAIYEMNVARDKVKLMFFNEKDFNCMHPTVSKDDKTLIFATDEVGGVGNSDLYICYKYGKSWSTPEILGEHFVNSPARDVFPYIVDEETIIFSSDRPGGYGKLDLYITKKTGKEKWSLPKNLGPTINSEEDDFGLILKADKGVGLLTSKRNGGVDQLFEFKLASFEVEE